MEKKRKPLFEGDMECQHCAKLNTIRLFKDVIKKPVKGEHRLRLEVEKKMTQASLP